jgi:hypothetical protein
MDEKRKIKDLNRDLDMLNEAGKQAKEDVDRVNSIGTSIKVKKQLLNEKRKKFETFRNELIQTPDGFEKISDMPFEDFGPSVEAQRKAIENVKIGFAGIKETSAPGPLLESISESGISQAKSSRSHITT